MIVRGSYKVPGTPEYVYGRLQEAAILQASIPGCQELKRTAEGRYDMKMKVAVAALSGDFNGAVKISEGERASRFRMSVEGSGRVGFLKGEGLLTLKPEEDTTVIAYDGTVQIGGTIAAVGQRLLDATSKMLIRMFFERFTRAIAGADAGTPPGAAG